MKASRFWWDDINIDHIARHGVHPLEAQEVIDDDPFVTYRGEGKYLAYGQTDGGRYLVVVYTWKSNERLRVITARDMNKRERRMFHRKRK